MRFKKRRIAELIDDTLERISQRATLIQKEMHESIEAAYDSRINPNLSDYTTSYMLHKIAELEIKIENLTRN